MATETEILQLLELAVGAYPLAETTEATFATWRASLADLPAEALKNALEAHICTCQFFPAIAELRRRALEAQTGLRELPNAYAAWEIVTGEIRRVGYLGQPVFALPLIATVVKQFGWRAICLSPNGDDVRNRFVQAYDRLLARETEKALLPSALQAVFYPSTNNPALAAPTALPALEAAP